MGILPLSVLFLELNFPLHFAERKRKAPISTAEMTVTTGDVAVPSSSPVSVRHNGLHTRKGNSGADNKYRQPLNPLWEKSAPKVNLLLQTGYQYKASSLHRIRHNAENIYQDDHKGFAGLGKL